MSQHNEQNDVIIHSQVRLVGELKKVEVLTGGLRLQDHSQKPDVSGQRYWSVVAGNTGTFGRDALLMHNNI